MAIKGWTPGVPDWWKGGGKPPRGMNYPTVTPPGWESGLTEPKGEGASWNRWQPYLRGLGINPFGGYLTATSPALRGRMNPQALSAMQDYFSRSPRSWEDYLAYSQGFMPRTPTMMGRSWMPARWR